MRIEGPPHEHRDAWPALRVALWPEEGSAAVRDAVDLVPSGAKAEAGLGFAETKYLVDFRRWLA